jgi:protease-4
VFTGTSALEKGLVDQVGYLDDAVNVAADLAGCDVPNRLLLYRRDNDRARTAYDVTPNIPLQNSIFPLSIPGLDRTRLPTFLYIWQIEPTLEKSGG